MINSDERTLSIEELISNIHSSKEIMKNSRYKRKTAKNSAVNILKYILNNLPVGMMMLITLFAALGTMVIMLKAEVTDLGGLREQVAANDSKFKIAVIEEKIEASEKERDALKKELVHIKKTVETIKNINANIKKLAVR